MKIPKKIKVGGHWWVIKYPYLFKERQDVFGLCEDAPKEISITELDSNGNKRADSSIFVTFLHEVLHALDFLNNQSIFKSDSFEETERRVDNLAEGIYQVLVDNNYLKIDK